MGGFLEVKKQQRRGSPSSFVPPAQRRGGYDGRGAESGSKEVEIKIWGIFWLERISGVRAQQSDMGPELWRFKLSEYAPIYYIRLSLSKALLPVTIQMSRLRKPPLSKHCTT